MSISKERWEKFFRMEEWREIEADARLQLDKARNSLETAPAEDLPKLQAECKELRSRLGLPKTKNLSSTMKESENDES